MSIVSGQMEAQLERIGADTIVYQARPIGLLGWIVGLGVRPIGQFDLTHYY